jgi:type I restriction enzyme S subunit
MMNWQKVRLGDVANFRTGKLNSNTAEINGKYPFFTCSPEIFKINNYAFDQKAILLAGNNAEGNFNIKYYEGKFNTYQRTYVIDTNSPVYIKYVFYALKLCLNQFKLLSQGTSTRFLTIKILNDFEIPLPPSPPSKQSPRPSPALTTRLN